MKTDLNCDTHYTYEPVPEVSILFGNFEDDFAYNGTNDKKMLLNKHVRTSAYDSV